MALIFTRNFRRNNPSLSRYINSGILTKSIKIIFLLFFIASIPLVNKAQDVLIGLTSNGGPEGEGTAFSIKNNGANYSIIKSFADWGKNPVGDLVKGNDGNYYGMTPDGGAYNYGTIFMMTPAGNITVLKQLNYTPGGANPMGELTKDADGNFWGLTSGGGANGYGTIFKITPAGAFSVIRHMSVTSDGSNPRGHLVLAKDGNFYGLTYHGGANGVGTIFRITPSGGFTRLRSLTLATDGGNSLSSLTEGKDGDLYGITFSGGANNVGTIFKIKKDGSSFTVLHNFSSTADGSGAQGDLVQASDGNFYGTCYGGGSGGVGTIFKMKPDGSYSVLHPLIWTTDGSNPYGSLLENSDGNLLILKKPPPLAVVMY